MLRCMGRHSSRVSFLILLAGNCDLESKCYACCWSVSWLMMAVFLLKPTSMPPIVISVCECLYLLQEAVQLGKPLLSDILATSELFIQLLINPLNCAWDCLILLCAFSGNFRLILGQQTSDGHIARLINVTGLLLHGKKAYKEAIQVTQKVPSLDDVTEASHI